MRSGYGRGYYGVGQLTRRTSSSRTGAWLKVALVLGAGAAVWFLWPRKKEQEEALQERPPATPPSTHLLPSTEESSVQTGSYPLQKSYEDAVVSSAKHLKEAGAQVTLAPHLQHLTKRLV